MQLNNDIIIYHLSDIHLEFKNSNFNKINKLNSILKNLNPDKINFLLLAGDIGYPNHDNYNKFLKYVSALFNYIIIIVGNHEYYSAQDNIDLLIKQKISSLPNIIFLNNSTWIYDNKIKFIGSTLWSNIDLKAYNAMNDKYYCYNDILEAKKLHQNDVEFLTQNITGEIPIVVITHHLPSKLCIDKKYVNCEINNGFASDVDFLIKYPVVLWIHGHTHEFVDIKINGIPVKCNPVGY